MPRTGKAYSLDDNGNRNTSGYTVGTNNRITEDPNYLYEFDDEGNLTRRENKSTGDYETYEWDHRNRLAEVSFYDDEDHLLKTVEHSYDALNRWIRRSVDEDGPGGDDPVDTFFAGYDGINPTLQFEGDAASDLSHRYLWGEQVDQLFAEEDVSSLSSAGALSWALVDHLGSIRDIAQHNQGTGVTSIANHRVYNAFGSLTSETNASIDLLFGFTGKPLDDSTGLQNNLNRWYSVDVGWWLSEDPLGFLANDSNLRRYSMNSPVDLIDPDGLEPVMPMVGGLFIGAETLVPNSRDPVTLVVNTDGMPLFHRIYVVGGTIVAKEVGVLGVSDGLHQHAAIDGHKQSILERLVVFKLGADQLVLTAGSIQGGVMPKGGILPKSGIPRGGSVPKVGSVPKGGSGPKVGKAPIDAVKKQNGDLFNRVRRPKYPHNEGNCLPRHTGNGIGLVRCSVVAR